MNVEATPFVPKEHPSEDAMASKEVVAGGDTGGSDHVIGEAGITPLSKDTSSALWKPQYRGRIRSFSEQKGFGFIDCQDTYAAFGRDVFIHRFQIVESGVWVGQEVLFEVELNKAGHPQARGVQPLSSDGMYWDQGSNWNYGSGMGYGGCDGGMYGNFRGSMAPGRERMTAPTASRSADSHGAPEQIEEMIRKCSGSSGLWEIIEQYGQFFSKKHVVTALYQLGLCRQYERRSGQPVPDARPLTRALVDRLVPVPPRELGADEASRVLWALAALEEVKEHLGAHRFAIQLGQEALKRHHEFSPAQMATFVNALSRLVRGAEEDELVGKITTQFSEYAVGSGAFPRFPPEELKTWTEFLQEASSAGSYAMGPPQSQAGLQLGMQQQLRGLGPGSMPQGGFFQGGMQMSKGMGPGPLQQMGPCGFQQGGPVHLNQDLSGMGPGMGVLGGPSGMPQNWQAGKGKGQLPGGMPLSTGGMKGGAAGALQGGPGGMGKGMDGVPKGKGSLAMMETIDFPKGMEGKGKPSGLGGLSFSGKGKGSILPESGFSGGLLGGPGNSQLGGFSGKGLGGMADGQGKGGPGRNPQGPPGAAGGRGPGNFNGKAKGGKGQVQTLQNDRGKAARPKGGVNDAAPTAGPRPVGLDLGSVRPPQAPAS